MRGQGGLYKAMTKDKSERLRGEGDQIKFFCLNLKEGKL